MTILPRALIEKVSAMFDSRETLPSFLETHYPEVKETDEMLEFERTIACAGTETLMIEPNLEEPDPTSQAHRNFLVSQYRPETTFYVSPSHRHFVDQIGGFEPLVSSEGVASFHGVFFGNIHLLDGSVHPVAVKPHKFIEGDIVSRREAEKSCMNDYFTNVAAQKACLGGLEPVGFVIGNEGTPYSLTTLDAELSPFDSIDWTVFFKEGQEITGMRDLWDKAARSIATLHSHGMSRHGDIATRNIATNPFGHVFLFDWEAGSVTLAKPRDAEERFGASWVDLKKLMEDMALPETREYKPGIGLFKHCKESWFDGFKEHFFDEYAAWRLDYAAQGSHRRKAVYEVAEELDQLEHALRLHMVDLEAAFRKK